MQLQIDPNGYITGYAEIGEISDGINFDGTIPDDFTIDHSHYQLRDGRLIKNPDYISEWDKDKIRARRQSECFAVIDRPLWFDELPEDKQAQLRQWRREWLDAPETGVIPEPPDWLLEMEVISSAGI